MKDHLAQADGEAPAAPSTNECSLTAVPKDCEPWCGSDHCLGGCGKRILQDRASQVYGIIDPDYGRAYTMIRKLAWDEGYAIGLHGSFTRDLDLIAVPWTDAASEPEHLVRRIEFATGLQGLHGNPGKKPQGRLVWTLMFPNFGDPRFVDLSIMPRVGAAPSGATNDSGKVLVAAAKDVSEASEQDDPNPVGD
jgi:hypothetical protein